jgi:hypothetical protein
MVRRTQDQGFSMLYVDIPTLADLTALASYRGDMAVSIYLPTTPVTQDAAADRIALKNLARDALGQLEAIDADKARAAALFERIDELEEDDAFWAHQAHSLALFATPDTLRSFRVPNALLSKVEVSDRFDITPLLRATTFANVAYVLALSEGAVRLVEVSPDLPATTVKVAELPRDAASAVGKASVNNLSQNTRVSGGKGQKVLLGQYARQVDRALRPVLSGSDIPLILASTEPLLSIYRGHNTYSHLVEPIIMGSPDRLTDSQLAEQARGVLDSVYRDEIAALVESYQAVAKQGRASADVAQVARAATMGAVGTLLVDIDAALHGTVDEDGLVTFADHASASSYDLLGEIAGRVIRTGGRVLGVRKADLPGAGHVAAILRYAV